MKRTLMSITLAGLTLLMAFPASADRLTRGGKDYGHITRLGKGIMEFGLDNVLVVKSISSTTPEVEGTDTGDTVSSTLTAVFVGGPTFRYFLIDNLSLSLNANVEIRHDSVSTKIGKAAETEAKSTSLGVLGTLMVDYYISVGRGMFIKPGIGGGGFYLSERTPTADPNIERKQTRLGGVGRFQFGFVYYVNNNWNLKANVDVLARFGSITPEEGESISLLEIDTGWNVGFAYIF